MLTKHSFLDQIRRQYVLTARAKGLPERRVLFKHVFPQCDAAARRGFPIGIHRRILFWKPC